MHALNLVLAAALLAGARPDGVFSRDTLFEVKAIQDADSPLWAKAPRYTVALSPQNIVAPMNLKPATTQLIVQSLHDDRGRIAFRLEWADPSPDMLPRLNQFPDAVALQFPLDPRNPPAPMMGHRPGGRVNIVQWRADWQRDVDKGNISVKDLYPNAVVDAPVDKVYKGQDMEAFSAGRNIGNIVSQPDKPRAVQDLMAEGYGSLTPKPIQHAEGRGTWRRGKWRVVIVRSMEADFDKDAAGLPAKSLSQIGFAVWNGGSGERGSRKAWAPWVPLTIE
jgi:DMSO reductase family type II enzyme heme b subunit